MIQKYSKHTAEALIEFKRYRIANCSMQLAPEDAYPSPTQSCFINKTFGETHYNGIPTVGFIIMEKAFVIVPLMLPFDFIQTKVKLPS